MAADDFPTQDAMAIAVLVSFSPENFIAISKKTMASTD